MTELFGRAFTVFTLAEKLRKCSIPRRWQACNLCGFSICPTLQSVVKKVSKLSRYLHNLKNHLSVSITSKVTYIERLW